MAKSIECGCSGPQALIREGATIFVDIGFDPTWREESGRKPDPGQLRVPALIDTGADISYIDSDLAKRLNLPPHDRTATVSGPVGKPQEVEGYLAQIFIPSLLVTQYGRFASVHLKQSGIRQQVQLGRTFLARFTLLYNGQTGSVTLTQTH